MEREVFLEEKMRHPTVIWFRQDLRVQDNLALYQAIQRNEPIIPLYILEDEMEKNWKMGEATFWWLHHSLKALKNQLKDLGLDLVIRKGKPIDILKELIQESKATHLFWNRCYEPDAIRRDSKIKSELKALSIHVESFNGSLLFEPWDISNKQNKPFQVFTPFWKTCIQNQIRKPIRIDEKKYQSFQIQSSVAIEDLNLLPKINWDTGFKAYWKPGASNAMKNLEFFIEHDILNYKETRDRPDIDGVSHLSPALHFGELSPNQIWDKVLAKYRGDEEGVECFLRQLGWREFAHHLLYHFPKTENEPLRKEFIQFPWKNEPNQLKAWQKGMTGYPLVDAGMRQLWATGWMHNRVRMVVGSFLVKDLLISWIEGAKWFFDTLVDADLANNTLGWQWVSGCGADAAPYFRIFNPTTQGEKFDPDGAYIRKWVPELKNMPTNWIHKPHLAPKDVLDMAGIVLGKDYPKPIVEHDKARDLALNALKEMKEF